MPLPLIGIGIGIAVAAVIAAAAGVFVWEKEVRGSKLTLIGPKEAGKTTWRTFLESGTIPAGYEHTTLTETIKKDYSLTDLKLRITVNDLSGSSDALGEWREYSEAADFVFFFVDITRLSDDEYLDNAKRFARQVHLWSNMTADVTLVATHADKDRGWKKGKGYDDLRTRGEVTNLKQLMGAKRTVVAALGSEDGCRDFTLRALSELARDE